jgi:hypothetical protein
VFNIGVEEISDLMLESEDDVEDGVASRAK